MHKECTNGVDALKEKKIMLLVCGSQLCPPSIIVDSDAPEVLLNMTKTHMA